MKLLVTGTSSGLGRALLHTLGGIAFDRSRPIDAAAEHGPFDAIIHCAFRANRNIPPAEIPAYLDDNAALTQRLLTIPHRTFILLSTVDLYPRDGGPYGEDWPLFADEARGIYPLSKMLSEHYVRTFSTDHLILRPASLLGETARSNTLMRLLTQTKATVALTPDSRFNAVDHADVATFIAAALQQGWRGIFNIAASANITLKDAAALTGCTVTYGTI
ncbi:MAG: NAD-dependent epimerase/dehydratase family protein, partial [Rhodospirillaceae bacterium]|nr:NAD-dependent epimerase/dehydratase family protein [Rhodospirillaceae bacterium]